MDNMKRVMILLTDLYRFKMTILSLRTFLRLQHGKYCINIDY